MGRRQCLVPGVVMSTGAGLEGSILVMRHCLLVLFLFLYCSSGVGLWVSVLVRDRTMSQPVEFLQHWGVRAVGKAMNESVQVLWRLWMV